MTQQDILRYFARIYSSLDEGAKQILINELRFYFDKRNQSNDLSTAFLTAAEIVEG